MAQQTDHSGLIQALQNTSLYDHPVERFEVLETHISWILLTGPYAYKIKKPVYFDFVDFSTLEKRRVSCFEEVRLNRRLSQDFYLDVIPLTGTFERPELNGESPPIEYAVKMRQFPQHAKLDQVLTRHELQHTHLGSLARGIADFHRGIEVAGSDTPFGEPEVVYRPIVETLGQIPFEGETTHVRDLRNSLQAWMEREHASRIKEFTQRKEQGFIRECHGDLHLENIALIHDQILVFDCLEFNASLRWIDVISEVAFLVMDLTARGRSDLGAYFLNAYLEHTGDYGGLVVFRFYETYRALVRAKVARIRLTQGWLEPEQESPIQQEFQGYLTLADRLTRQTHPALMITHGVSGAGKTTISQTLFQTMGAIRIRSDIERKRLFGLPPDKRSERAAKSEIYAHHTTHATYKRLEELARILLHAGFQVIVDATFLQRQHRDVFRGLASQFKVPFLILDMQGPKALLRKRVVARGEEGRDPSEADLAVLEQQLGKQDRLEEDEWPRVCPIDSEQPVDIERITRALKT